MLGWVVLAGVIWCDFKPERYGAAITLGKERWIASYLKTRDLHAANKESDFFVLFPDSDAPFIADWLHWLEQQHLSFFRTANGSAVSAATQAAPSR